MTQQERENKIKELEKQIAELKMEKVEATQSKRREMNKNDIYWFVSEGSIWQSVWYNDSDDKWRYLTDNCFQSKEEAEEYKKQIEYTARYKHYIEEHSEPLDLNNFAQDKWFAYYDIMGNEIVAGCVISLLAQGTIHASSKQVIEDAIKEIGEDNFKKYVLGVK